jgi:alanyl-tRNA synthetase
MKRSRYAISALYGSLGKVMTVSTIKLYRQDPYRTAFEAQVLACTPAGDRWEVVLDQTCFYPEGGGQPCDLGTLGDRRVLDVREDEATGAIIHITDGPVSGRVAGCIDWERRLDHMQQHTGQHLLSGTFERLLDAETVSWHLGSESCTVDITLETLTPEQAEAVELACNEVIRNTLPVLTHEVDEDGVKALPLRKPPAVTGLIRVVEIQGYDWSACGGTHVRSTGELGLLKIKSWERYKKLTRVVFLVGNRALRDYLNLDRLTRDLCRSLSIGVADLPRYVARCQEEASGLRRQVKVLQERILEAEAAELVAGARTVSGVRIVRLVATGRTPDEVKLLAAKVAAHPGTVAVLGTRGAMPQIVLHRSLDLRLDMGAIIRQILPLIDGKGGGSPVQAQGAGSKPDGLEQALDHAVKRIAEALHVS